VSEITENVKIVREKMAEAAIRAGVNPESIALVAATKMNDADRVREAVKAGIDAAGENRVQELLQKNEQGAYEGVPIHLIGHLQKNKVKNVVGLCDLIQSVDSVGLMEAISKRAESRGAVQDILIEVNIGGEAAKSGIAPAKLKELTDAAAGFKGIFVRGLMTIPPISEKPGGNRIYFQKMYKLFVDISLKKYDNISMDILSMGMSGDYEDAILEGANMVRVGSAIFGARHYPEKAAL
jgi:hypothetical protein